jgi:hypothetical protein
VDKQQTLSEPGSRARQLEDFTKTMQTLPVNKTATPMEAHIANAWLAKQRQKNTRVYSIDVMKKQG